MQCVAVCCSLLWVLQRVAVWVKLQMRDEGDLLKFLWYHISDAARCSVLQCVAVCCSVLQCVAVCCCVVTFWNFFDTISVLTLPEKTCRLFLFSLSHLHMYYTHARTSNTHNNKHKSQTQTYTYTQTQQRASARTRINTNTDNETHTLSLSLPLPFTNRLLRSLARLSFQIYLCVWTYISILYI